MDTPALGFDDPKTQGILALAAGLLQAGGPSRYPVPFGAALGQAMGSASQMQAENQKMRYMQQQAQALEYANKRAKYQMDILDRYSALPQQPAAAGGSATPAPTGLSDASAAATGAPWAAASGLPQQAPASPQAAPSGYFNPQQMFQEGMLYLRAGLPHGSDLINAALAHDNALRPPVALRPGGSLVSTAGQNIYTAPNIPVGMQMNGGAAQNIPGFIPSMGQQEALKAGTNAAYAVHPVTQASGATVPTFGANLPGFPGIPGSLGQVNSPTAPVAPAPRPMVPKGAAGDPWASMPKLAVPTGMGQSTYQKELAGKQAAFASSLSEKYGSAAEQADSRIALNKQALGLIDQADTGPGAATQAEVKSWLMKFGGIPESDFANSPSATKALDKDLLNAATQKAKAQFGARITQQEVVLMLSRGSPNVDMPKAAMKYLIESDIAGLTYQKQQASDLGRYLSQGGDPHQFEAWYTHHFPMSGAVSQVHLGTKRPPLSSFQKP
jgi:hypothetical protein